MSPYGLAGGNVVDTSTVVVAAVVDTACVVVGAAVVDGGRVEVVGATVVGGDTVALMEGWHRVNRIRRGKDRWTPTELVAARAELFADRPTGVPKFSM